MKTAIAALTLLFGSAAAFSPCPNKTDASWRFINLSDWHLAEKFVFRDAKKNNSYARTRQNDVELVNYLKKKYGGELVIIPGDTNAGFWDRQSFQQEFKKYFQSDLSPSEIVMEAGKRCYSGMLEVFKEGGYSNLLVAYGDHEAGATKIFYQ